ncbi:MAG: hypothetical protein ACRDKX_00315, partial [Solirubrobacterales bacterium]
GVGGRRPIFQMPLEGIPGANFALQRAGLGTIIGTAVAYGLRRGRPDFEVGPAIAAFTHAGAP